MSVDFTSELYQTFKEWTIIFPTLAKKKKWRKLLDSFYEAISLISLLWSRTRHYKEINYTAISLVNVDEKIINKMLANQVQYHIKRIMFDNQMRFISGSKDDSTYKY